MKTPESKGAARNAEANANTVSWSSLAYAVLTERCWKFLGLVFGLVVIVCAAAIVVWIAVLYFAKQQRLEITQTATGGVIYRVGSDETLTFLLSASEAWVSTGFYVRKGDALTIRASGQVNLALHHLVDSDRFHTNPPFPWVGPYGMNNEQRSRLGKQDRFREAFLLVTNDNASYGALVAGVSSDEISPPKRDFIWNVGKSWDGVAPKSGFLWLAVNDVYLGPDTQVAFDIPASNRDVGYVLHGSWNTISNEHYWNVFFDDNIGAFSVTVKRER